MSEGLAYDRALHALDRAALAAALPVGRTAAVAFVPLAARLHAARAPEPAPAAVPEPEPVSVVDPQEIAADAYALGLADGRREAEAALDEERAALLRLSQTLVALTPQPSGDLALLLAATVDRLVRQVVGEVEIDALVLLARAKAAAALIADETVPGRMRLHPDDVARLDGADLPVALVADPALKPGTVLLETRDGWIEHGPEMALARLQTALDGLGMPR